MEVSLNIFLQIFALSGFAGFIAWFYALFESIMTMRFTPFVFEKGLLFLETSEVLPLSQNHIPSDSRLETKTGQFKFINNHTCYFRPKKEWKRYGLRGGTARTPFSIRGKISWQEDAAKIEGRLPLGASIFVLCVLVGVTAFCINFWINESVGCGLFLLIGSWLFIGGMNLFSIAYEYERAEKIIGELKEYLNKEQSPMGLKSDCF